MEEVNKNIATIFQQNIPSGKKALQDSHKNLAEIADYCERQYVSVNNTYKGNDKTKALDETRTVFAETKQYATQSLASVAYQIHALAASVLDLLDNQASQLNQMNSDISYISNVVHVHKEKVARREIGVLASSKNTTRGHKIIAPSQREQPKRYQRQPIDYNALDNVGHGSKSTAPPESKRTASVRSSRGSSVSSTTPNPPPPTAPKAVTTGTLRVRAKNQPPPSAPPPPPEIPKVPNGPPPPVLPNVAPPPPPIVNAPGSPIDLPPPPPPPPMPADLDTMSPEPPPPPPMTLDVDRNQNPVPDLLPPPPSPFANQGEPSRSGEFSPLPPPPPELNDHASSVPAWAPENYEEKVISIYDYEATRDDELSFREGEIIYVLKKNDDGWYEGVMNGMTGLFPGNYVGASP